MKDEDEKICEIVAATVANCKDSIDKIYDGGSCLEFAEIDKSLAAAGYFTSLNNELVNCFEYLTTVVGVGQVWWVDSGFPNDDPRSYRVVRALKK